MMKKLSILLFACCAIAAATTQKPRVLIIGDSISMGYTPFVKTQLADVAEVLRPGDDADPPKKVNCGGTERGVKQADNWLATGGADKKWDVITFNFGLHDLKHVEPGTLRASRDASHPNQETVESYTKNLEAIVAKLKKSGAKLIYVTTTPFHGVQPNPYRDSAQVALYNAAAVQVAKANGIEVLDLCAYVLANPDMMRKDNVHFYDKDSEKLAEQVSGSIRKALEKPAGKRK